jgi:hypothetical protein
LRRLRRGLRRRGGGEDDRPVGGRRWGRRRDERGLQAKRLAGDKLEVIAFERMLTDVEAIDLQAGTVAVG